MQTATSETESKFHDQSICVHHYTSRAPCPEGQGNSQYRPSMSICFCTGVHLIGNSLAFSDASRAGNDQADGNDGGGARGELRAS